MSCPFGMRPALPATPRRSAEPRSEFRKEQIVCMCISLFVSMSLCLFVSLSLCVKGSCHSKTVTQVAAAMILPTLFVAADMGSDTNMLVTMFTYYNSTKSAAVYSLMWISTLILLFSTLSLLTSNPLPSLLRGAHTAVAIGSREEEEQDVPLPLGEW